MIALWISKSSAETTSPPGPPSFASRVMYNGRHDNAINAASPRASPRTNPTTLRNGGSGLAKVPARIALWSTSPPPESKAINQVLTSDSNVAFKLLCQRRTRLGEIDPAISSSAPTASPETCGSSTGITSAKSQTSAASSIDSTKPAANRASRNLAESNCRGSPDTAQESSRTTLSAFRSSCSSSPVAKAWLPSTSETRTNSSPGSTNASTTCGGNKPRFAAIDLYPAATSSSDAVSPAVASETAPPDVTTSEADAKIGSVA